MNKCRHRSILEMLPSTTNMTFDIKDSVDSIKSSLSLSHGESSSAGNKSGSGNGGTFKISMFKEERIKPEAAQPDLKST